MSATIRMLQVGYCGPCKKMQEQVFADPHKWVEEHNRKHHPETEES